MNPDKKLKKGEKCLKVINYLIKSYKVARYNFVEQRNDDLLPGYYVVLQFHTDSDIRHLNLLSISRYVVMPLRLNLFKIDIKHLNLLPIFEKCLIIVDDGANRLL